MDWKTACKIAAPAAACAGAFAFLIAPGHATRAQKAPFVYRNYAHRGLHTEDGTVPENSLPAFRAAAEAGYAVEMDVHLTADDQLVVFHDDTLERMCGVPGVIDDFTLAELRALRLGDTDCVIPTFAEALEALGGRVPLLLEVKRGHNNRRLCALTLAALRTYGGPYCVESFDPTIVAWFRRNAPDILRGQLSQPPKDYGKALNKPAAAIVGNVLTNVIARPQFIAYKIGPKPLSVRLCEAMGAVRAGWTSRAWTHEHDYDIVIFEHYRPIPETLIDAGCAITGCGPAFAYMFMEALADGGVKCGLPRAKAIRYAAQMLAGSAEMVLQSGKHPEQLKDDVCSPGGSTIAGVDALEQRGFRGSCIAAVDAAFEKTRQLG